MHTAVVWFRRDFRLHDHTALVHALQWAKEREGKLLFSFILTLISPKSERIIMNTFSNS